MNLRRSTEPDHRGSETSQLMLKIHKRPCLWWLCLKLNKEKMADIILEEAVKNSFGITQDDMIVIVAKIVKRK